MSIAWLARGEATSKGDNSFMGRSNIGTQKILTVIILFTLALAAAAAVISTTQKSEEFSSTTPEGVVQLYLRAVIDGRYESAAQYFSTSSECDATDIDRTYIPDSVRVNLGSTEIEGERAFLDVAVEIYSDGPLDNGYTEKHSYRLAKESGNWRILGIPWPLYSCEEPKS